MTIAEAKERVAAGEPFGDVFPALDTEDHRNELRAWFVLAPGLPALSSRHRKSAVPTGEVCPTCQGPNLVRTGTCKTCQDCGASEGCG